MADLTVQQTLERAKLCEDIEGALIEKFAGCFRSETLAAGTQFIKHDTQSKDFYIISSGIVEVEIPVIGMNTNSALARLKPGESVGEFVLLRDARRTATAKVVNESRVIVASSDVVLKLFDEEPVLGYGVFRNLAKILADRLNDTNMQLRSELSRSRIV